MNNYFLIVERILYIPNATALPTTVKIPPSTGTSTTSSSNPAWENAKDIKQKESKKRTFFFISTAKV